MKQIAVNVHVFAAHCSWMKDEVSYYSSTEATTTPACPSGYIPVYSGQVIIEEPNRAALINATVARLRKDQSELRAKAEEAATTIEGQIRNMLALSYEEPAS